MQGAKLTQIKLNRPCGTRVHAIQSDNPATNTQQPFTFIALRYPKHTKYPTMAKAIHTCIHAPRTYTKYVDTRKQMPSKRLPLKQSGLQA